MSRHLLIKSVFAAAVAAASSAVHAQTYVAQLNGFEEIGALNASSGAIFSGGTGNLVLNVNKKAGSIAYTLTYSGLGAAVTQAHIHFGKIHVAGGVMVFFCSNLGNGPAGTPACPANGGTVSGTLTAASVVGPAGQNITPGNFDAVVAALRSNTAYANIHTVQFPAGEIRGQVVVPSDDENEQ